jgi:hypothetical protein
MPVEKVSLSLEADVVAEARAESGGNLSAYVNEALEARQRNRHLREVLDDIRPEFEPLSLEEAAAVHREFDDAMAKARAGWAELERILVDGTDVLNDHPLVDEALIALGPLRLPNAYVVLTDEQRPVAAVARELGDYLTDRLHTARRIQLVIVARHPDDRAPLAGVVP